MDGITVFNARPQGSPQSVVECVLASDHAARLKVAEDALRAALEHQSCTCTFPSDNCCPVAQAREALGEGGKADGK